jgi:hypothetical protein
VVNDARISLFLLNISTATYLRDAGVAGSNPATPTKKSLSFLPLLPGAFKVNHRFNRRNPVLGRYAIGGAMQEVR